MLTCPILLIMALSTVTYQDIPVYLCDSAFYLSLSPDASTEFIEIPAEFYKPDDQISNEQDLVLLLNVIKFWGVDAVPNSLTQYLLDNKFPDIALLHDDDNECQMFNDVTTIFKYPGSRLKNAIMLERTEVVNYLLEKREDIEKPEMVAVAALVGRVDYLKLLFASGYKGDGTEFDIATQRDQVHCLQYLHEMNGILPVSVVAAAVGSDSPLCLAYAYQHNCTDNQIMHEIVRYGSVECLACVHQHGEPFLKNMCAELIEARAYARMRSHQSECLRYVLANGYTPNAGSCRLACKYGALDMLRVLHEYGVTIDQKCTNTAAKAGHLDVLKFLHEVNCAWDEDTTTEAAQAGQLDCLRYAIEHDCPTSKDILLHAARRNQVQVLRFLIEEQNFHMPENYTLFEAAFERFHFESVVYLIDVGCPFADFKFFWLSALQPLNDGQFLKCIMFAVEHGWKNSASLLPTVKRSVHALPDCYEYLTELCGEQTDKDGDDHNSQSSS